MSKLYKFFKWLFGEKFIHRNMCKLCGRKWISFFTSSNYCSFKCREGRDLFPMDK